MALLGRLTSLQCPHGLDEVTATYRSGRIKLAKSQTEHARKRAVEAAREADRAEAKPGRSGWKTMVAPLSLPRP